MTKNLGLGLAGALFVGWIVLSFSVGATALGGLFAVAGLILLTYSLTVRVPARRSAPPVRSPEPMHPSSELARVPLLTTTSINGAFTTGHGWPEPSTPAQTPSHEGASDDLRRERDPDELADNFAADEAIIDPPLSRSWFLSAAPRRPLVVVLVIVLAVGGLGGGVAAWLNSRPSEGLLTLQRSSGDSSSEDGLLQAIATCQKFRDDPDDYFQSSSGTGNGLIRPEFDGFFTPRCRGQSPSFEVTLLAFTLDSLDADARVVACQALEDDRLRPYFDGAQKNSFDRKYVLADEDGNRQGDFSLERTYRPFRDLKFSEYESGILAFC